MKALAILSLLGALGIGGLWWAQGRHLATLSERPVISRSVDEFGDEVEIVHWEKTWQIGLDIAGPAGGGLLGLGALLLVLSARRAKRTGAQEHLVSTDRARSAHSKGGR